MRKPKQLRVSPLGTLWQRIYDPNVAPVIAGMLPFSLGVGGQLYGHQPGSKRFISAQDQ